MNTTHHHSTDTTHNAGFPPAAPQAPTASSIRKAEGLLEVEIASELYLVGLTEDGEEYQAERYFLLATDRAGNRWRHVSLFEGCQRVVEHTEQESIARFVDRRKEAFSAAKALFISYFVGGQLDVADAPELWVTTAPVYGSRAYQGA